MKKITDKEILNKLFEKAGLGNNCNLETCKKCTFRKYCKQYERYEIIKKDLKVLEFFKKLFINTIPIQLIDLQDGKYLSIPNSDIRRPDALLPLSEKEYKLLKEWFKSNLLKEIIKDDK